MGEFYRPLLKDTWHLTLQSGFVKSGILWSPFPISAAMLILLMFVAFLFLFKQKHESWIPTIKQVGKAFLSTTAVTAAGFVLVAAFEAVFYAPYMVLDNRATTAVSVAVQKQKAGDEQQMAHLRKQYDAKRKALTAEEAALTTETHNIGKLSVADAANIRWIQTPLPSPDAALPYAIKVIIQPNRDFAAPVTFAVICDQTVERGEAAPEGLAMYTGKSGSAVGHPNIFLIEINDQTIKPENTIVFRLFSRSPLRATGIVVQ